MEVVPSDHPLLRDPRSSVVFTPARVVTGLKKYGLKLGWEKHMGLLAPQERALVRILQAALAAKKKALLTEREFKEEVRAGAAGRILVTNQEPWRIFQYYRGHLVRIGIVEVVRK